MLRTGREAGPPQISLVSRSLLDEIISKKDSYLSHFNECIDIDTIFVIGIHSRGNCQIPTTGCIEVTDFGPDDQQDTCTESEFLQNQLLLKPELVEGLNFTLEIRRPNFKRRENMKLFNLNRGMNDIVNDSNKAFSDGAPLQTSSSIEATNPINFRAQTLVA